MTQKPQYVGTLLRAAGAHSTRYVGFSSHAMSDAEPAAIISCVRDIARMSCGHVLFVGSRAGNIIMGQAVSGDLVIEAMPWLPSEWNDHLMAAPEFVEALFRTP